MDFVRNVRMIDVDDWDQLVEDTYGKPYNFQQQDGCQLRGVFWFNVPEDNKDEFVKDSIPVVVNGKDRGVKFEVWLDTEPDAFNDDFRYDWEVRLFWDRNFYPDIRMIINDLYEKGILEEGEYAIDIDW